MSRPSPKLGHYLGMVISPPVLWALSERVSISGDWVYFWPHFPRAVVLFSWASLAEQGDVGSPHTFLFFSRSMKGRQGAWEEGRKGRGQKNSLRRN